jgi:cation:H+ antiporter
MAIFEVIGNLGVLIVSLAVLAASAKYVVEKAIRLAKYFGISEFAVGFIFIAVMTSLPELSVAVLSSVTGQNNLSLGDVLGSNVTNIALVLGLCGFIGLNYRPRKNEINNMLILIAVSLVPLILIADGQLTHADGLILLLIFVAFLFFILSEKFSINKIEGITKIEAAKDFLVFVISIGMVIVSAGFAVESAIGIATKLGIFQSFIGATIVALSTSVPELAVDITAVRKGRGRLALGDILGSNVTNLTLILGINTLLNPFLPNMKMAGPLILFVLATAGVLSYVLWKHNTIRKNGGLLLLGMYILYILAMVGIQIYQLAPAA